MTGIILNCPVKKVRNINFIIDRVFERTSTLSDLNFPHKTISQVSFSPKIVDQNKKTAID